MKNILFSRKTLGFILIAFCFAFTLNCLHVYGFKFFTGNSFLGEKNIIARSLELTIGVLGFNIYYALKENKPEAKDSGVFYIFGKKISVLITSLLWNPFSRNHK